MTLETRLRTHLAAQADDWKPGRNPADVLDEIRSTGTSSVDIVIEPDIRRARTRTRTRYLGLAAICLSVVLVVTLALLTGARQQAGNTRLPLGTVASPQAAEIDQLAVNISADAGVDSPSSVTWIATTRGAASSAIMQAVLGAIAGAQQVYALEIYSGTSVYTASMPGLFDEPPAHSSYLLVIVDRSTFAVTDVGFAKTEASMAVLGSPETDSLSGITPLSAQKFQREFPDASG
jgi:hypothetical protein